MHSSLLVSFAYIVGIFGTLGGMAAYFYKGRADSLLSLYEKELKLVHGDNERMQNRQIEMQAEQREHLKQLASQQGQIDQLTQLVTQAPQIERLITEQQKNHQEVLSKLMQILKASNA